MIRHKRIIVPIMDPIYGTLIHLSRGAAAAPLSEVRLSQTQDPAQQDDASRAPRRVRADAQRNEDAVLEAAKQVFAISGVDAPVRDIAARAGVGVGTLYRRFPKRADLVAAVFRREVETCAAEATHLATSHPPDQALVLWLRRYAAFLATKRGLASALHSGDPAFEPLPAFFRARFEPALAALLAAAAQAGKIRGDIAAYDLLRAIGNLSTATGDDGPAHTARMVSLLIDGLRAGAG